MTDNITVNIDAAEPEVAATLDELRYLVFEGQKGDTGDSAYEEAVSLGFVGTEAEWIASLKGETGNTGAAGADGVSPTVAIAQTTGGHRVTITDAEHPQGQSFNVLDGAIVGTLQPDGTLYVEDMNLVADFDSEVF